MSRYQKAAGPPETKTMQRLRRGDSGAADRAARSQSTARAPPIPDSLHLGSIAAIVVNAVAVERQGRIAKQQRPLRADFPDPRRAGGCRLRLRRRIVRFGSLPVNDIVLFDQGQTFPVADFMPYDDEDQWPAAALFMVHVNDPRNSRYLLSHAQRALELHAIAGEHAPRQRHRRKKLSALGVPVCTQFRLPGKRPEIEPVPERR